MKTSHKCCKICGWFYHITKQRNKFYAESQYWKFDRLLLCVQAPNELSYEPSCLRALFNSTTSIFKKELNKINFYCTYYMYWVCYTSVNLNDSQKHLDTR